MPLVTAAHALSILEEKLSSRWKSVRECFIDLDYDLDGVVSKAEFRVTLDLMGLVMIDSEYDKVWAILDKNGTGWVDYNTFNQEIGHMLHPTVSRPLVNRPQTPRVRATNAKKFARSVVQTMKSLEDAFKHIDSDNSGRISHAEFTQALYHAGLGRLSHDESYEVMTRYKDPMDDEPGISFATFKTTMEQYLKLDDAVQLANMEAFTPDVTIPLSHAERLLTEKLWGKFTQVQRAFRAFDTDKSGFLSYGEFRNALLSLGIRLTDADFRELVAKYDTNADGQISYDEFNARVGPMIHPEAVNTQLKQAGARHGVAGAPFYSAHETLKPTEEEKLAETVTDRAGFAAKRLQVTEGEAAIAIQLYGRSKQFQSQLRKADVTGEGFVSVDALQGIFDGMGVTVSAGQMQSLLSKYDTASNGSINYDDLNARLSPLLLESESNAFLLGLGGLPQSAVRTKPQSTKSSRAPSRQSDAMSVATDAINLDDVEAKMKRVLGRSWTKVYGDMQRKQTQSGDVTNDQFRDSMAKSGVPLTSKEVRALARKYASTQGGMDYSKCFDATFGAA
jgi:Ca2+-binding EF-hand superfamily protein